jgi:DNA-binding beta-propeller fold protein YncE
VRATVSEASGGLHLRWTAPGVTEQVIPPTALYTLELAGNGLLGKYYQGNNWAGAPVYTQKDLFIFPNDLVPAPFSIEWEGKVYAPRAGTYTFGTLSDDGSLLYLDGKLVVDNGGHHADRYVENRVTLNEGLHDLRLRYFQDDGGRRMELWWIPPGGGKEMVPVAYLFPPGVTPVTPVAITPPAPQPTPVPPVTTPLPTPVSPGAPQPPVVTTPPAVPQLGAMGLLATWGRAGSGPGEFRDPRGIAVDAQGRLYVADTGNRRVQVLDANGQPLAQWAGPSPAFIEPCAVAVSPQGQVYVLDTQADIAYRFSAQGEPQGTLGAGSGLYRPRGIAVDREGNVYVANTGGNNVVKFSAAGDVLAQIGRAGKGNGQLDQPCDVAVDEQGNVYVVDTLNQRVQRFDRTGRYQGQWLLTRSDTAYAPHLALAAGIIYVTEPEGGRLLACSAGGALLGTWGSPGTGEGQFTKPVGLAIDSRGRLFVADAGNNRVQVWGAQ